MANRPQNKQENRPDNRVDFEKLRKRRQRVLTVRRLIALAVILVLVFSILAVNSYLIDNSFTIRISDWVESFGGSGYPIPVPGGVIRNVRSLDTELAVLNDTNLYIYNKKGKTLSTVQRMSENAVLVTSSKRALIFEGGGKRYVVTTPSKQLVDKSYEFNIQGADINDRGDYVLVSSSSQYVAQVTVFNNKNEWYFQWFSSDSMVQDVAISAKGTHMAVGCVNTRGGRIYSTLFLFDLGQKAEQAKLELEGELVLQVSYLDDGRVGVLTDCGWRIYSDSLSGSKVYDFGGLEVRGMDRRGKETLLLLGNTGTRAQELVLLDGDCKVALRAELAGQARDIALGDGRLYVLTDTGVTAYTREMEPKETLELRGISDIHLVKNRLYYLSKDEINVFG